MKTYYGMELLDNAKPQLVHNQFAATKPLPTGGGKTVSSWLSRWHTRRHAGKKRINLCHSLHIHH